MECNHRSMTQYGTAEQQLMCRSRELLFDPQASTLHCQHVHRHSLLLLSPRALCPLARSPRRVLGFGFTSSVVLPVLNYSASLHHALSLFFNGRSSKSNYTRAWCWLLWRSGRSGITSPSAWGRWKCCEISPNTGSRASNIMRTPCTSYRRFSPAMISAATLVHVLFSF